LKADHNLASTRASHWRRVIIDVLGGMPPGAWTTVGDLAAFLGLSDAAISLHLKNVQPAGMERVLTANGKLRKCLAFEGQSPRTRATKLAAAHGIRLDPTWRADPADRLGPDGLDAIALAVNGSGSGRSGRIWPDEAAILNIDPEDRERLIALASTCQWASVAGNGHLLDRADLAKAIGYMPTRMVAAVGLGRGKPTWPTRTLVDAGLVGAEETAILHGVNLIGLRSLGEGAAVEVYCLAGPLGAAPILAITRILPGAPAGDGPPTPCHKGRHHECRGKSTCPCSCGCTRSDRATTVAHLAKGDEFSTSFHRKSIVQALPEPIPEEPGWVRLAERDKRTGYALDLRWSANQIVTVHNPRRRHMAKR
jgi:hypothetical protein